MTATKKTTKAKTTTLRLTSRAKMGAARKTKKIKAAPERAEEITAELIEAGTDPAAAEVIGDEIA